MQYDYYDNNNYIGWTQETSKKTYNNVMNIAFDFIL